MTLRELLAYEQLSNLTVINEKADLDRFVSSVESTETPDVATYVAKDSFIITTAMIYKGDQHKLCELILRLNALPCAGLGIKIGRFVDKLEPMVIETADSVGFPLIAIPMSQTLGNVYHNFLSIIWDTKNKQLIEVLNAQRKYYDLIIHGASLRHLLNIIGTTVKKRMLIINRMGLVLAQYNTSHAENQIARSMVHAIDKDAGCCVSNVQFNSEREEDVQVTFHPIKSINRNLHYMVVFEYEKDPSNTNYLLEEIVLILGMYFYKDLFIKYNDIHLRNEFLKMIIQYEQHDNLSLLQILKVGQGHGLKRSTVYRIMVCRFRRAETRKFQNVQMTYREEQYILIYEYLRKKVEQVSGGSIIVFPDVEKWQYVFLLQDESDLLGKIIQELKSAVEDAFQEQMVFAYGNYVFDVGVIVNSYWEAMDMLENLQTSSSEYLIQYQPKGVLELLKGISERHVDEVCRRLLKDLAYPDNEMNRELRHTLKTYLDCHCSIVETANQLYVHRNTVRYRIKKCEEIMEVDLMDASLCFQIQLCLYMSEMP